MLAQRMSLLRNKKAPMRPAFPTLRFRHPAFPNVWFRQPAFPIFWFGHFVLLSPPRKRNGSDVQERALSVLTQSTRGEFQRPTMMSKTLGPISLPATDT